MVELYLGLGSNMGDREANLKAAKDLLDEALGRRADAESSVIETESWGFEAPPFLNCVLRYDLERGSEDPAGEAEAILVICKGIESRLGRTAAQATVDGIYHSRPVDIDILFYGRETISTRRLTVPHEHMAERDFVMIPLREIVSERIMDSFREIFIIN